MGSEAEAEVHQQHLTEKSAREQLRSPLPMHWPHDENGEPMAIVCGAGSDLVPTVTFGNVVIGPVTIMRPVKNDPNTLAEEAAFTQELASYVVGSRRRLLQWALDPSSRIEHPVTGAVLTVDQFRQGMESAPAEAAQAATPEPAGAPASPAGDKATGDAPGSSTPNVTAG